MNTPRQSEIYPDRHLDCQFALEDRFIEIMADAERFGWTSQDAASAIIDLADNYMLKLFANAETDRQIRTAIEDARNRED